MVLKGQYIRASYNNRKYFTLGGCSLWEGVMVLKGQYIQASYNNRKYFSLLSHSPCSKLTPLTPACSQLAPARSQWPMNSLICIGVPTTSGGKGLGGELPAQYPHSQLAPIAASSLPLLQLAPSSLQLAPAHSSLLQLTSSLLPMGNKQFSMYWGPHHL